MQTDEMISVIIPVYKVEKELPVCLDHLLAQTYQNLQIILVVDGSPDNSLAVCRSYAQKDKRIVVIDQENQGVSAARNAGMDRADGTYISFIDADDYVADDYFAVLHQDILQQNADVVCCDFVELMDGEIIHETGPKVLVNRRIQNSDEIYRDMVSFQEFYWSCVWGKLLKADLAKQFRFPAMKFGEDHVYMFDVLSHAHGVYLDTYKGYFYIRRPGSVTMDADAYHVARRLDELKMNQYKVANLPACAHDERNLFFRQYAVSTLALAQAVAVSGEWEHWDLVRSSMKEVLGSTEVLSKKIRIHLLLCRYMPRAYGRWIKYRSGM